MFALVTFITITAGVSLIFFLPLELQVMNSLIQTKEKKTTLASRVYENGCPGKKTYLTQGILLFKIKDRPYFNHTLHIKHTLSV